MARLPRFVIPGQSQHIIQRGNNRQALFGADADYRLFRGALVEAATLQGLAIHANEAARRLNQARAELFQLINTSQTHAA